MTAPMTGTPLKSEKDLLIPDDTDSSTPTQTQPTSPLQSPVTEGDAPPVEGADVISPTDYKEMKEKLEQAERIVNAQKAVLKDQNDQLLTRPAEAIPTPTPAAEPDAVDPNKFWNNPEDRIRNLIKEEIQTISQPLNLQLAENKINLMKQTVASEYGDAFGQMEPFVDNLIAQAQATGTEVNKAVIEFAAAAAYGNLIKTGALTTVPTPTPPTGDNNVTVPHMRPSPGVPPENLKETPKLRPLTENEARLAREQGMSHAAYLAWIEEDSEKVVSSNIGKEGWEEKK